MASQVKTYILSPNWNISPEGTGAPKIGHILITPKDPQAVLNEDGFIAVPDDDISSHSTYDLDMKNEHHTTARVSIWTSFLAPILGISLDAAQSVRKSGSSEYVCRKLETMYFPPGTKLSEYVEKQLENNDVRSYLNRFLHNSVYMIVGLKIARGAKISTTEGHGNGTDVRVGLDGTPAGVPVSGGPGVSWDKDKSEAVKFGSCDDFVIAYRLAKITVKRDGSFSRKDYNRGALMDDQERPKRMEQVEMEDWDEEERIEKDGGQIVNDGNETCKVVSID